MLSKVRRAMKKQSENFTKEIGNIKKYQIDIIKLKNTITELKIQQRGSIAD